LSFVHLHHHTPFSNGKMLDSIAKIDDTLKRVKELGQSAWAVTDHDTCSGLVDAFSKTQKFNKKNNTSIHFVFGAELYMTHDVTIQQKDLSHITFWAKNEVGLMNLNKLTTVAHGDKGNSPDNFYHKSRVDIDMIRKYSEGLICGTACLGGLIKRNNCEDLIVQIKEIFGEDFYIEIHTFQHEEQYVANKRLIQYAQTYDIPMIACVDSHYVLKEDAETHRQFRNASKEKEDGYYTTDDFYLHSEDEVREKLSYLPLDIVQQAIDNTQVLADKCKVEIKFGQKHYPDYPCDDQVEEIKKICRKNWKDKLPDKKRWQSDAERFNHELGVFIKQDYPGYFLITYDVLKKCRELNVPTGPGRGSVVASLIAYLMDITKLDPIKYNLIFERFAHNERISPPDIDNDVSTKGRHQVIEYIREKYGEVYQCRTFSYLKASSALRRAGKALEYDHEYINNLAKSLTKYESDDEDDTDISDYDKQLWMLDHIKTSEIEPLINLAKKFVGIIQGYGKHASAVIVLNQDINKFCSVERQVDSKTKEVHYVAACDFKLLEEMGLLKMDILGLRTLDIVQDTLDYANVQIDFDNIPLDDPKTSEMLCKGETMGCFQISSPGMTQLVKRIQPKEFSDLIPLVALYRPGPLDAVVEETGLSMVETYVEVRNKTQQAVYLHPKLEPILKDTYGIILYQEQILEIAKELCGYSLGEADMLRRIIGKKKVEEMKPAIEKLIERGVANGIDRNIMQKIADAIVTFALYGFNKGHSAGYGKLAYDTSYLKAHYPLEFICACINSKDGKHEETMPYINEAKRMGIKILPPDARVGNMEWSIEGNSIRVGLRYLKGAGKNTNLSKVDTFEDVINNNPKDVAEALIKSGSLDYLGKSRGELLAQLEPLQKILDRREQCLQKIAENQTALDSADEEKSIRKYTRQLKGWQEKLEECNCKEIIVHSDKYDEVQGEYEILGFGFMEAPRLKEGTITRVFTKLDKKNRMMAFIDMQTKYGLIKCVAFASDYKKWQKIIQHGNVCLFICDNGILKDIKGVM
jgi:DNA polymerase III subunit alpha